MTDTARPGTERAHICVMGVSGVGKTTIAAALAELLGRSFGDADDLHPQANIDKMAAGRPLTDADRSPWLDTVVAWLDDHADDDPMVFACSALRRTYRDHLARARVGVLFVHLTAPTAELRRRLTQRSGHFMKVTMLESQLNTLEPLADDENGVTVETTGTVEQSAEAARSAVEMCVRRGT